MYLMLTQRVEGKAQTLVKLCETGHGLEAMCRIYDEYRPSVPSSRHGLLVLLDWESLVAQCERDSGESISGAIRCATQPTPMAPERQHDASADPKTPLPLVLVPSEL
eukprot:2869401-Amphidinium_carterae.1